jgi:hypothetical protein
VPKAVLAKLQKQLVFNHLRFKKLVPSCCNLWSHVEAEAFDSYKIIYNKS